MMFKSFSLWTTGAIVATLLGGYAFVLSGRHLTTADFKLSSSEVQAARAALKTAILYAVLPPVAPPHYASTELAYAYRTQLTVVSSLPYSISDQDLRPLADFLKRLPNVSAGGTQEQLQAASQPAEVRP